MYWGGRKRGEGYREKTRRKMSWNAKGDGGEENNEEEKSESSKRGRTEGTRLAKREERVG